MRFLYLAIALLSMQTLFAQTTLNSDAREAGYVANVQKRAATVVKALALSDATQTKNVENVVCNYQFELDDLNATFAKSFKFANDSMPAGRREHVLQNMGNKRMAELYTHHFALARNLSVYLNEQQIETVKDGLTLNKVQSSYAAVLKQYPTLKEADKKKAMAFLKEAREYALDATAEADIQKCFDDYLSRIQEEFLIAGY